MTRNQQALVQALLAAGISLFLLGVGLMALVSVPIGALFAGLGFVMLIVTFVVSSTLEPLKTTEEIAAGKRSHRGLWIALGVLFVVVMGGGVIQVLMSS